MADGLRCVMSDDDLTLDGMRTARSLITACLADEVSTDGEDQMVDIIAEVMQDPEMAAKTIAALVGMVSGVVMVRADEDGVEAGEMWRRGIQASLAKWGF